MKFIRLVKCPTCDERFPSDGQCPHCMAGGLSQHLNEKNFCHSEPPVSSAMPKLNEGKGLSNLSKRSREVTIFLRIIAGISIAAIGLLIYFLGVKPLLYSRARVTRLAIEKNDPSFCWKMSMFAETCDGMPCAPIFLCLMDMAKATKNRKACDLLGPSMSKQQQECYVAIDTPLQLVEDCQKISYDDGAAGLCMAIAAEQAEDATICNNLIDVGAAICYLQYVRSLENPSVLLCDQMPPVANLYGEQYKEACYREIAIKKH